MQKGRFPFLKRLCIKANREQLSPPIAAKRGCHNAFAFDTQQKSSEGPDRIMTHPGLPQTCQHNSISPAWCWQMLHCKIEELVCNTQMFSEPADLSGLQFLPCTLLTTSMPIPLQCKQCLVYPKKTVVGGEGLKPPRSPNTVYLHLHQ